MDIFADIISECENFVALKSINSDLIVVNAVPGSGKSTLIKKLLHANSRFKAFTFSAYIETSITGRYIRPASEFTESKEGDIIIVDEFTEGNFSDLKPRIIFGDLNQTIKVQRNLEVNYYCKVTRRFGEATCNLLRSLRFEIECTGREDKVEIERVFEGEPIGVVICFHERVKKLCESHGLEYKTVEEVRGATFNTTTFIVEESVIKACERHLYYIGLTRHTDKLLILSPDATLTAA
ncbi:triple gene block protein 1 [Agapanthus carlavirus B]|uniref:Triple gene block protein 1 n=1 Tax=Agapanthus carlavirus B TaxID=2838076 RepID=A0A8E7PFN3_9VIRU|nr:triple gene block protein 1 [Agapanthus carlavirus B]QVY47451.1 triple gene block protein 1 [Agapanthus carlavirus B]